MFSSETKFVRRKILIFGSIGGLLSAIGGLLLLGFPLLVNMGMDSQFVIEEGNQVTKAWKHIPHPVTNRVYIWNIENPVEFRRGAKPRVKEMGPYVYKKQTWKEIISWGPHEESVKYWLVSSWKFDPERSVGQPHDKLTIVNVPVYTMTAVIRGLVSKLPLSFAMTPMVFGLVNVVFSSHNEGFIKQVTAQQLIEGYPVNILKTIDRVAKPLSWFGIKLPDSGMPNNMFGILHIKNNTKAGPYEILTGKHNPKQFDRFISYKGKRSLKIYSDHKCNLINGTEGITFGRFLNKKDPVYVFNGDVCRSIYATYKELSSYKGIPAWRYVLPESLFAGPNKNPANKCFCTTGKNYNKCDGIFDLGPCQNGAPLAFSFPHLWHASKLIQSGVYGMNPDQQKHESILDVNPIIGTPIRATGRLQVNLLIKPNLYLSELRRVRETVLPFVWVEEEGGIGGNFVTMMRLTTYALIALDYSPLFLLMSGLILLVYASYLSFKKWKILFGHEIELKPFVQFSNMKIAMEGNGNLNPYLFSVSDKVLSNPGLFNKIDQLNLREKEKKNKPQSVNNKMNRIQWSPPGAIE